MRQDQQCGEEEALVAPAVGLRADQHRERDHHQLRRDDAGRHQAGAHVLVLRARASARPAAASPRWRGETAARRSRRRAGGGNSPRPRSRTADLAGFDGSAVVQPAGQVVIDGALRNCEDADQARDRHRAEKVKHHSWPEPVGRDARESSRHRVAGVIERLVAADPPGEGGMAENAERDGCDCRRKDDRAGLGDALRNRDRNEARKQRQRQRCERDHDGCNRHDCPLCPRDVDQRTRRCLRHDTGDGRNRHHQTNTRLVPMLLGEEIDGQIGPKPVADVGEEEIGRIERTAGASLVVIVGHEGSFLASVSSQAA